MNTTVTDSIPYALQERLRFVEAMLLWEGAVQRSRVSEVFGVAPNHVTRDIQFYLARHPGGLEFKPAERAYVAGPNFSPEYASEDPTEYLGLLNTRAETGSTAFVPLLGGEGVGVGVLPSPALGIDKFILREIVRAIRKHSGLEVTYHALRDNAASRRKIWPHALMNTGSRWYARAWDSTEGMYRDLVLSRIESPTKLSEPQPAGIDKDLAWSSFRIAEVVPNPKLNAHQQRVVAREFGMKRERYGLCWPVKLRQCLVGYFARRYKLDAKPPFSPQSHWVILRNRNDLKPYFLPTTDDSTGD